MMLHTVILAAGKGQRMASDLPKVMHTLGGIPLLQHVFNSASALTDNSIHIVYGSGGDTIKKNFAHINANWVEQQQQLGTGHAVQQALPHCHPDGRVLILYGDVPLIRAETLRALLKQTPSNGLGILVANVDNPTGFGRIIRDVTGNIIQIVEERDANCSQKTITEINTGIMTCPTRLLTQWLPTLSSNNQQKEYYLTDIVATAVAENTDIYSVNAMCCSETQGVNDLWQLTQLERHYQQQQAKKLALAGVKIMDPQRLDIRGDNIRIARGVAIDINVILAGKVTIATNTHIGANCLLKDCDIGQSVTILPNTIIEGATIASGSQVGPFARIRPETVLEENTKVGNFVEIKKTRLGTNSKANHLTYLGDSEIGKNVNIGAGTITCNYDGIKKSQTTIKDGAFIGSNTALIAPVVVGEGATIGAGSTISQHAPDHQLTVARSKQRSLEAWKPKERD